MILFPWTAKKRFIRRRRFWSCRVRISRFRVFRRRRRWCTRLGLYISRWIWRRIRFRPSWFSRRQKIVLRSKNSTTKSPRKSLKIPSPPTPPQNNPSNSSSKNPKSFTKSIGKTKASFHRRKAPPKTSQVRTSSIKRKKNKNFSH